MKPLLTSRIILLALWLASGGLFSAARAQTPTWDAAWTAGGAGAVWAFGTASDASGNVFACGRFAGADVAFGTFSLSNAATAPGVAAANQNGYLAKYSPSGTVLWVRQASVTGFSSFSSMATDAAGNVYTCGVYSGGALTLGATTLPAPTTGPQPGFVAKYDPQGTLLWARQLNTTSSAGAISVAVSAGAVFVAGSFGGSLDVSGLPSLTTANATADTDAYLVKLDTQGVPQWSRQAGGGGFDNGAAVAVDASGSPVLGGHFTSATLTAGSTTLNNAAATVSNFSYDIFLVKYDGQGAQQWAQRAGGSGPVDRCYGLAAGPSGTFYMAGSLDMAGGTVGGTTFGTTTTGTGALLASFSATGTGQWARREGGGSSYNSVALDPGNNLVVAGSMSGTLVLGAQTLNSAGNNDILTARYTAAGTPIGAGRAGGSSNDFAFATCSDPANGQTVVGHTLSFTVNLGGGTNLNYTGSTQDALVIKYASSGAISFAKRISTYGGNEYLNGTAVDAQGNTYVTGTFVNNIRLGSVTLTTGASSQRRDGFVVKYSPTGAVLWTRQFSNCYSGGLGVDAAGNLYVAGSFTGSLTLGSTTLSSTGGSTDSDAFLVKYDPQGTVLWARSGGGTDYDGIGIVAVNAAGQVALGGNSYSPGLAFGGQTASVAANTNSAFVVRYDATGNTQWVRAFAGTGSSSYPYIDALAVDAAGGVGIAGDFSDNVTIGTSTFTTPTANDYQAFIAKCSPSGAVQWAQQATGANSFGQAAAFDPAGNLAVTVYLMGTSTIGSFNLSPPRNSSSALAKFDSNGTAQWAQTSGGTAGTSSNALVADAAGNFYAGGDYGSGSATFGSITLPSVTSSRPLVVRYNGQGTPQWAVSTPLSTFGYIQFLAIGPNNGTLTTSGYYTSSLQFTTALNVQASETQGTDLFIARLAGAVPLATAAPHTALPALALYPNPARGTATVLLPPGLAGQPLRLRDALGREVRRFATPAFGATEATLDLRGLPAGLYLLRAGEATGKLVVE